MTKNVIVSVGILLSISTAVFGWVPGELPRNYTFDGVFDSLVIMPHGIVVDRYNRIWIGCYGSCPLIVKNPDGTQAPFSPIDSVVIPGDTVIFLDRNCRGMALDHEGNILYVKGNILIKLNVETGEGIARWTGPGTLTKPAVDTFGYIYVGTVVGVTPIHVLDPSTFELVYTIDLTPAAGFARGIEVSKDGKDLWTGNLNPGGPVYHYHSDIPGVLPYDLVEEISVDDYGNPIFQFTITTVDWGPDNTLWCSHETEDPQLQSQNGLVVLNYNTMEYATLYMPEVPEGSYNGPRGVAFSLSGDTAYVVSFNGHRVWRYVVTTGVEEHNQVASCCRLENHPNPFRHTTTITFTLFRSGFVDLKVYDIDGRIVKTLITRHMTPGSYEVQFDATTLPSGTYLCRMEVDGRVTTLKMLVVK